MSLSGTTFISLLKEKFTDQTVKESYIDSSKGYLRRGQGNRVFNDFTVMPDEIFNEFNKQYQNHLRIIKKNTKTDDGIKLTLEKDKQAIDKLCLAVINYCINELTETNGKIKKEIIDLLQWNEFAKNINSTDIICAYVNAFNQQVAQASSELINKNPETYAAIANHMKDHCRALTTEALRKMHSSRKKPLNRIPSDKDIDAQPSPRASSHPSLFLLLAMASIGGAYMLFSPTKPTFGINPLDKSNDPKPGPGVL